MLQISHDHGKRDSSVRWTQAVAIVAAAVSPGIWIAIRQRHLSAHVDSLLLISAVPLALLWLLRRRENVSKLLRDTDRLLRGVVQVNVDGVIALKAKRDEDGNVVDFQFILANPAAENILGRSWAQLCSTSFRAAVSPSPIGACFDTFVNVVNTGVSTEFQFDFGASDATTCRWIIVVKLDDGVAVTLESATHRRRTEAKPTTSSSRLAELMRSVPLPMLTIDPKGTVISWNPAAERLFGWSEHEAVGHFVPFLGENDRAEFEARVARVLEGQSIQGHTTRRFCKDGRAVDLIVSIAPLFGEDGKVDSGVAVYDDVTSATAMQEAIRFSEARLKLALEVSNVGMWDWRLKTCELFFSETWCTMLGYAEGELPSGLETFQKLSHPDDLPDLFRRWEEHASGRTPLFSTELRMAHKDGHWLWIRTSGRVIERDTDGVAVRALGTHTDVTAYRRSEAELQASSVRLRAVLDALPLAAIIYDFDRVALQWNPAAERLFGWTAEEAVGKPIRAVPDELVDDWKKNVRDRVAAGECVTGYQTRRLRRDGSVVEVIQSAGPLRDTNGVIDSILIIVSDETERLAAERTIRQQQQFLRNVLDVNPNLIYAKDQDGRYTLANQAFADTCGTSIQNLLGKTIAELVGRPEEVDRSREDDLRVMSTHEDFVADVEFMSTFTGKRRLFHMVKRPLIDPDGVCRQIIGVSTDITAQDNARLELAAARDAAERDRKLAEESREIAQQANMAKSRFLANMSHEIRTPMTAILGFADRLSDPLLGADDRADCLQTIRRNGTHLIGVINDILDFSKIEAGRMTVEQIDCNPCRVVGDVVSLMRLRAAEAGLALDVFYPGPVPTKIQSDPTRLRQVLMNLISNAIKFTPKGRVSIHVEMPPDGDGQSPRLSFAVTDTGVGMSADETDRLFQPFIQADASTTRRFGGTGLGLVICKRLAVMLGGDITVQSVPGIGSTFTLTIDPGDVASVSNVADPMNETFAPVPVDTAVEETPLIGRVLLAEDGVDNQRLISMLLRRRGLTVEIVDDGKKVIDRIETNPTAFDLILMDMQMPVMDGYAATATLRQRGYSRPIVAVTAHVADDDRRTCLSVGCSDFLGKPVDRRAMATLLGKYLRGGVDQVEPLKSRYQEETLMRDLIRGYVDNLPHLVAELQRQLQADDLAQLRLSTHRLKGSGGGYGFDSISAQAGRAESSIKAGLALKQVHSEVEELIRTLRRVDGYQAENEKEVRETA